MTDMRLHINGERGDYPEGITVEDLLKLCHIPADHVAVLVNDDVILKTQRAEHRLHNGDMVELLTYAPGG